MSWWSWTPQSRSQSSGWSINVGSGARTLKRGLLPRSAGKREALADYFLDNSGDHDALSAQVDELWGQLESRLADG